MIFFNIQLPIKWFRNTLFLLCCFIGLNGLYAQCSYDIDTVCVNEPDSLFINIAPQFTSLNWSTNNGATLTVLPGDTLVVVDWSTSSILNAVDSVCITGTDAAACMETLCMFTYLEDCIPPCTVPEVPLTLKRVGAPTICEILAANPAHPIGTADCDGGGQNNLDECTAGQDPEDLSDDEVCPASCQGPCGPTSYYYIAGDNHGISTEQTSGPALTDSGYPYIGTMTFGDCMLPQPTPAVMTYTNTGFCLGGIIEMHWDGASTSFTDIANPCGTGFLVTQADFNAPVLTEITFNSGTPIATNVALDDNGGPVNGGEIRNAIIAANVLPACMIFSGYVNAATGETNCQDHIGNYPGWRIPCTGCALSDGSKIDHFTIKIENSTGDYAVYLFKTL